MKDEILNNIKLQYKSLTVPNYDFIKENQKQESYRKIIKEIKSNFSVNDITDFNDDVSYVFNIGNSLTVYISLVGHYVVIVENGLFVKEEQTPHKLKKIISDNNFTILSKAAAEERIKFSAFKAEINDTRVFHALFSDIDIPWMTSC